MKIREVLIAEACVKLAGGGNDALARGDWFAVYRLARAELRLSKANVL